MKRTSLSTKSVQNVKLLGCGHLNLKAAGWIRGTLHIPKYPSHTRSTHLPSIHRLHLTFSAPSHPSQTHCPLLIAPASSISVSFGALKVRNQRI